ncbi:NAD(P)H-hydrate dehydratase [Dokdonella sp. MW10]|uniref:NAD(P)H-hydrate dehydratase n=1 Tax=Dokdonella sp. MW10 TaxID=2992926 RepID=UPI003F809579
MPPPGRADGSRPTALTPSFLRRHPLPSVEGIASKEDRGRVLVIGGSREVAGAVLLAGVAALRAGAGKLQIATCAPIAPHLALSVPEAKVMGLPSRGGHIARASRDLLQAARHADAILIGCGMDATASTRHLVSEIHAVRTAPLVLDAGAISACTQLDVHDTSTLITPHHGEMAALLDIPVENLDTDPVKLVHAFSQRTGFALVLKGTSSFVGTPDGPTLRYALGCVGLGTSGSGDVLAGLVAGFLARGASPRDALAWAVASHGEAGRQLSRRYGPLGFLAREIAGEVPSILHAWGRGTGQQRA